MDEIFEVKVEFHDNTALEKKSELTYLVASFNQQNNTQIEFLGTFCSSLGQASLQFIGQDAHKTTSCAQFVCETINEDSSLPLTYTHNQRDSHITLH